MTEVVYAPSAQLANAPVRYLIPPHRDVFVIQPGLEFYISQLESQHRFAFVKRSHGFWDRLVDLLTVDLGYKGFVEEVVRSPSRQGNAIPYLTSLRLSPAQIQSLEARSPYKHLWSTGLFRQHIADLLMGPLDLDFYEGNAMEAFTHAPPGMSAGWPARILRPAYLSAVPGGRRYHDSLVFKDGAIEGTLERLLASIRPYRVVLIGPGHLADLGQRLCWPHFHHLYIPPFQAMAIREEISAAARTLIASFGGAPTVVVLQAGSLSWWLAYRLYAELPCATFLDVGRSIDAWYPAVAADQNWYKVHEEQITRGAQVKPSANG